MIQFLLWSVGGVALLIVVYLLLTKTKEYDDELSSSLWHERWDRVEKYLQGASEAEWRMAVIEADKFLDSALKFKGIGGENLGQRLKVAQAKYQDLRKVWPAHILRNKLVHEPDYHLSKKQATGAISDFKQAVKLLGFKVKRH